MSEQLRRLIKEAGYEPVSYSFGPGGVCYVGVSVIDEYTFIRDLIRSAFDEDDDKDTNMEYLLNGVLGVTCSRQAGSETILYWPTFIWEEV